MRKSAQILFVLFSFLFVLPAVFGTSHAAYFKFDEQVFNVAVGSTFQIQVMVDAGSDQVVSADAYVIYDSSLLEATTITDGTFFPVVSSNIASGKVSIYGLPDTAVFYKTGSGTLATITFKGLKNGTGTITYDCRESASDTSKIIKNDGNATNIIVCASNERADVTVGTGGSSTPTPISGAPTGTPTTLPQTGILDNLVKFAVPGTLLLILGTVVRFLL